MSRARLIAIAVLAAGALGAATGTALGAFATTTSNTGNSFSAKQVFSGDRSTTGWDWRDASGGGAETNSTFTPALEDSLLWRTTAWTTTYASDRYLDFDFNDSLPASISVSGVSFRFKFASTATGSACYYFEVRRASTGAVLGTFGSSGTPAGCANGTTQTTVTTDISSVVSSSTDANDLRIRVYGFAPGSKAWDVDGARITGTAVGSSFSLYPEQTIDAADSTPATTVWSIGASDSTSYTTASNWATTFSTSRYLKLTFPSYVPSGATINSASFTYSYKSANAGDNTCWYFELYNGTTLIGTHGNSTTPVSCNSTTSYVTDTVPMSELDTVTEANNAVVKIYEKNSGSKKSITDLGKLTVSYYVN